MGVKAHLMTIVMPSGEPARTQRVATLLQHNPPLEKYWQIPKILFLLMFKIGMVTNQKIKHEKSYDFAREMSVVTKFLFSPAEAYFCCCLGNLLIC